jgi:hypothetical protein
MSFWAGSNIKKSDDNVFSWRGNSELMKDPSMKRIEVANQIKKKNIEPRYSGLVLATKRKISA